MPVSDLLAATVTALGLSAGLYALRLAWQHQREPGRAATGLGWSLILATMIAVSLLIGVERGLIFVGSLISVVAAVAIMLGIERRDTRRRRRQGQIAPIDPAERQSRWARGTWRWVLAGPISGAAGLAIGMVIAIHAPMLEADRLILGGAMVPLIWGFGTAWALTDTGVVRPSVGLIGTSAIGFAVSFLIG